MLRSILVLLAALALSAPAQAQASFPVTFRFLPDLTTPVRTPVLRAFAPGTMPPGTINDWGPNSNGNIAPGAPSQMTFDAAANEYRYTETLTAGTDYFYKIHYHTNSTAPSYGGTWIADPLNPRTTGPNSDSAILVTDPMAFQLAREQDGTDRVQAVSAGLFGSQPITAITYEVNGEAFADGLQFYDAATRIFRKPLAAPVAPGAQFKITATDAQGRTASASVGVAPPTVVDAPVPAGVRDGITVINPIQAVLVLRAPGKQFVHVIGDFSDWEAQDAYVMNRDTSDPLGTRWWIRLKISETATNRFQYLVDGTLRTSDPYSPLVLDEGSDRFVPQVTFPSLPAYPAGKTTGLVSVIPPVESLPTPTPAYTRPAPEDLVIYEMLVRDWTSRHDFQTIRDSLSYFKRLGVTAIELMPVSEFDGNESWGYNPNHYFAVDKYYGSPEALKALVNEAHRQGLAVILDVVYNHQTGQSPFVQLYNAGGTSAPTADNPWVNPAARHPFNVFNDNNHESALTQYWLDAANRWWLEEYRVDGFRYDLSKGFTQTCGGGPCTDANFSAYNQPRIDILTRMADRVWDVDPTAYVILEHFADANEERVLAAHGRDRGRPGMMLWSNMNTAYSEAAMGYLNAQSDLRRAYPPNNGYPLTGQVAYMESHDEQWLMYKTRTFGACAASPTGGAACDGAAGYNTRDLFTALGRQSLDAAFFLTVPGPKMLWQFGEVGYGGGPGECLRDNPCPAGTPGRVSNKPIRWDYVADVDPAANGTGLTLTKASPAERARRRALYANFSTLLALRTGYDVFRTPTSVTMNVGSGVADRTIRLEKDGLVVVVAGNFGLTERTSTPPLAVGSTWTDVIGRGTVAGGASVTLAPGEWRIYANRDLRVPTADAPEAPSAEAFALTAVFPNPTAGRATVRYSLSEASTVRLEVLDVLGRRVALLADGPRATGAHEAAFDAAGLPAGIYVLRLAAGARAATARVTVAR